MHRTPGSAVASVRVMHTTFETPMSEWTGRRSLATLAILGCITILTAAVFIAVTYTQWDWLSTLLGALSAVLLVMCVRGLLDALDTWLDRPERRVPPERQQ